MPRRRSSTPARRPDSPAAQAGRPPTARNGSERGVEPPRWRGHCACGGGCSRCSSRPPNGALRNPAAVDPLLALVLHPANVSDLMQHSIASAPTRPDLLLPGGQHAGWQGGRIGETVAAAHGAQAVTLGTTLFGPDGLSPAVMRHELVHAAQARAGGPEAARDELEAEAARLGGSKLPMTEISVRHRAPAGLVLHHPAIKSLLRAGRWLARRTTDTLSKHVAKHGRRIVDKAVHSIFKDPTEIKKLATVAVSDAARLAEKYAAKGAGEVLEEGGVKVVIQGRMAGKFRVVIDKDFKRVIGTAGEEIIRVVVDNSGRIVTAFPVQRVVAIGLGVVAVDVFTEHTADAAEEAMEAIEAHENRPTDWGTEIVDLLIDAASGGLLGPSTVNEGESLDLELDRIVWEAAQATILEIEATEGIRLTEEQKWAIYDLALIAIGSPMEFADIQAEVVNDAGVP